MVAVHRVNCGSIGLRGRTTGFRDLDAPYDEFPWVMQVSRRQSGDAFFDAR